MQQLFSSPDTYVERCFTVVADRVPLVDKNVLLSCYIGEIDNLFIFVDSKYVLQNAASGNNPEKQFTFLCFYTNNLAFLNA